MIIKLKGTTFTNTVTIGEEKQPSANAKAFAQNVSRALTTAQLVALDSFVANLKNDGIWGKIIHLYIPSLAFVNGGENTREAFIDVVSSFGNTPVFGIEEEDAKETFVYKNGGISNKTAIINSKRKGASFINGESVNDSHAFFFIKDGANVKSQDGIENSWDRGFTNKQKAYWFLNSSNIAIATSDIDFNFINTFKANDVFGHTAINNTGSTYISSAFWKDVDISTLKNFPEDAKFGTSEIQLSFGLVSFGKGLTKEQSNKYILHIKELMSKL